MYQGFMIAIIFCFSNREVSCDWSAITEHTQILETITTTTTCRSNQSSKQHGSDIDSKILLSTTSNVVLLDLRPAIITPNAMAARSTAPASVSTTTLIEKRPQAPNRTWSVVDSQQMSFQSLLLVDQLLHTPTSLVDKRRYEVSILCNRRRKYAAQSMRRLHI